ncbi:MAG: hypothetical protein JWN88_1066 [Frankiales bacterium]|nr:hypothetical protein [Frankiales bacterium]
MSYLLRVVLPDKPGMLGALATALGRVGADILSLDVVERGVDGAVDDLLVSLPPGGLADTLITSAQSVPGVVVESLRPYHGGQDLHRDLQLVEQLAAQPASAMEALVHGLPGVFRASWALLVGPGSSDGTQVLAASPGAPDLDPAGLPWLPLATGRHLDVRERWVPEHWRSLGTVLVATPVGSPHRAVLVGRVGGPPYRQSELLRLTHLAGITSTVVEGAAVPIAAD